jgi:integrase
LIEKDETMASIKKCTNGDGSISYRVRIVVGHKSDGTPIQGMRSCRTRKDADTLARQWETDRDRGLRGDPGKVRVGEYVQGWMLRSAKRVRPSTLAGYRYLIDRYIMPGLGGSLLRELTPASLQAWIDTLPTPDTAHRCRRTLHICLEEAVRLNLLALNPADRVTTPPKGASTAAAWSRDSGRRFLAAAANHTYQPYWTLALRLGLRPSELLGLRWAAVNLDAGTVAVAEARATVANRSYKGAPKSDAGNRVLDMPADLVVHLRAHKARQNAERLALGPVWRGNDLVCCGELGQPIAYRNLTRAFKRVCGVAGVPMIRLYDLRHTAISLMAEAGADIKAISEVAGHANVLITRNIYQHINRAQRAAALGHLAEALGDTQPEPPAALFRS